MSEQLPPNKPRDPNLNDLRKLLDHLPTARIVQASQLIWMGKFMKWGEQFLKLFHNEKTRD